MKKIFIAFANKVSEWSGSPWAFIAALAIIIIWAVCGPIFQYSETWQLVVNTATTIITFLMVFVLQNSQNRDGKAMQAKLDELIWASQAANSFIGAENLDEKQLRAMSDKLAQNARQADKRADKVAHKNHKSSNSSSSKAPSRSKKS